MFLPIFFFILATMAGFLGYTSDQPLWYGATFLLILSGVFEWIEQRKPAKEE